MRWITDAVRRFDNASAVLSVIGIVVAIITAAASPLLGVVIATATLIVVGAISAVGTYLVRDRYGETYAVTELRHHWDIVDATGSFAVHEKSMSVEFLQDNVLATWDTNWGDGERRYTSCRPGVLVDFFSVGGKSHSLVSLREKRARGDRETFRFTREITNGFLGEQEWVDVETTATTRLAVVEITFPRDRRPHRVTLSTGRDPHARELDASHLVERGDRLMFKWERSNPRKDTYTFRWTW